MSTTPVKPPAKPRKRRPSKDDHVTMSLEASDPHRSGNRCFVASNTSMLCRHCGESFPMPHGAMTWVVAVMDAFRKEHRECRVPNSGEESGS